ncbi:hypothetical protein ACOME3_005000 [Neoechinorhynchus agilis]
MGSGASLPGENQTAQIDPSTEGFHVLQVQDKSPGYNAGIEPYFDFIVSANENRLDQENNILSKILESNLNQEIRLYIYSIKTRDIRVVRVVPDDQWGGRGLLGLSIRYCTFSNLEETVWHVQDVIPGSPAANAGLLSDKDYIVGADANIHAPEDIFAFIENNNLNTIRLYVYNHLMDQTRMVLLTPNSDWGGPGFIGCQLSYGYLHRIPAQAKPEKHIPIVGTSDEKFSSVFSNDISTSNNDDSMNLKNAVASNNGISFLL